MASGMSPYVQAAQQQYQQQSPYGGGMGRGGYSRYRPNLGGAVTGPTGTGGTGGEDMAQNREAAQSEARTRAGVADDTVNGLAAGGQANAEQNAQGIKDYRQVRDSGIGNDNLNTSNDQRQQAKALGIDPSSDASTIAGAASGKTSFDANGMPTGAGTAQALPTGSDAVTAAAAAAQNAKDGGAAATQANAYAGGYNAAQPPASTASPNPFAGGAPAMPAMPPLTLNMPPPVNPGSTTPPAVGDASTSVGQVAKPMMPPANVNAPLKPAAIKPFGSPTPRNRRPVMT